MSDLFKCSVKKWKDVLWTFATTASLAILIVAASLILVWFGEFMILPAAISLCNTIIIPTITFLLSAISTLWSSFLALPAWAHTGLIVFAGIPLAAFIYSFLWCVARDLEEEDWKSDLGFTISMILSWLVGLSIGYYLSVIALPSGDMCVDIIGGIVIGAFFASVMTFASALANSIFPPGSPPGRILRFPGAAYHHYTKSKSIIKEEP